MQLLSDSEQLDELMEELNDKVSAFAPLPCGDIRVGVVCCAPSSLDQRWYRVSIVAASNVVSVSSMTEMVRPQSVYPTAHTPLFLVPTVPMW